MSPPASSGPDQVPRKVYLLQIWGGAAVAASFAMAIGMAFLPDPSADSALFWVVLAALGWQAVTMVGVALFNRRRYGVTAPGWEAP
ncbi:MAG: hypothetical protein F4153_02520 [Acidimicrobiia bacterium]|nr:hypothetical protein [Acidimicrobiia bacterium]